MAVQRERRPLADGQEVPPPRWACECYAASSGCCVTVPFTSVDLVRGRRIAGDALVAAHAPVLSVLGSS